MSTHYNPRIVRNGLMLQLDAANTKSYPGSGTTWSDISGSSNTCTLVDGPTYSSGTISFDGVANRGHVSSPSGKFSWSPDATFNQSYTFDVWFKSSDATNGRVLSKPWNGGGEYNYRIELDQFYISTSSANNILFGRNLANNTWTNIVCWIDATNMGYYINYNEYSGSKAHGLTGNIPAGGNLNLEVCIMSLYPYGSGWAGNTSFSVAGNLVSVRIYNKVLTAAEVAQNFNATRWRFNV